jgi:hypothetical protein
MLILLAQTKFGVKTGGQKACDNGVKKLGE